ncbi:retrotransposon protein, putative, unclassified [Panicum miliaceum]|uniref:Retrotransposon protein, putative, unclassified n=1 Tax=Panicum miliaceum TaxID=4540 RepID=A0A3L6PJW2_PANMI|nr:retrotransposon protein, putative, unclassified [Panicum miliaceum]
MEAVERMMERMKLSAAEKKGIRVEGSGPARARTLEAHAIGKVLADKLVSEEGLKQTLGRIWCPIKGILSAGKKRALEEGLWMFGKDLVVMVDFGNSKTIEELDFSFIPIWIRVMKLPLGMMKRATGEAIGDEIGEFMPMDLDDDDTAVGRFIRIKVKLDIRKPLMRGLTVCVREENRPVWCPVEYEYLPDFCYTCGIIGHTDKVCGVKLSRGEVQQYSKKLRCMLERSRLDDGSGDRFGGGRFILHWKSSGNGGRSFSSSSRGSASRTRTQCDDAGACQEGAKAYLP